MDNSDHTRGPQCLPILAAVIGDEFPTLPHLFGGPGSKTQSIETRAVNLRHLKALEGKVLFSKALEGPEIGDITKLTDLHIDLLALPQEGKHSEVIKKIQKVCCAQLSAEVFSQDAPCFAQH